MINTPVSYDDSENVLYPYPQVEDANGSFIFECKDKQVAQELVKRINMHDDLMRALCGIQQMCIGDISMVYKLESETIGQLISAATGLTARELLEKCK